MNENNTPGFEPTENNNRAKWAQFVETQAVDFFSNAKLEKMTLEDGNGNKAKLAKTKDCGIKLEYTSTTML